MRETGTKEWKVLDVREGKTEPNPHGGEFQKYYVDFEGSDDTYWRRRAGDKPEVGRSYYGTISEGNFGPIFKKEKVPDGALSGSSEASTGKREWKPESQYDPEKVARMSRAHAQEMALRWAALLPDRGDLTLAKIFQFTDAFERDVETSGQAASPTQGLTHAKESASPPTSASPESGSPSAELNELAECARALDTAGLTYAPARDKVAQYMVTMPEADRLRAIKQLVDAGDPETLAMTLRAMKQRTESALKKPLPSAPNPDDDIPF
jgi:hypothetical protein